MLQTMDINQHTPVERASRSLRRWDSMSDEERQKFADALVLEEVQAVLDKRKS
jgi:hypothetical protein